MKVMIMSDSPRLSACHMPPGAKPEFFNGLRVQRETAVPSAFEKE